MRTACRLVLDAGLDGFLECCALYVGAEGTKMKNSAYGGMEGKPFSANQQRWWDALDCERFTMVISMAKYRASPQEVAIAKKLSALLPSPARVPDASWPPPACGSPALRSPAALAAQGCCPGGVVKLPRWYDFDAEGCPAEYPELVRGVLAPMPHFTLEDWHTELRRQSKEWTWRMIVHDSELYVLENDYGYGAVFHQFISLSLKTLAVALATKLRNGGDKQAFDAPFTVSCSDWSKGSGFGAGAFPVFQVNDDNTSWTIPVPNNMHAIVRQQELLQEDHAWDKKAEVGFHRASLMCPSNRRGKNCTSCPRWILTNMSRAERRKTGDEDPPKPLLDVALINQNPQECDYPAGVQPYEPKPQVFITEHGRFKYLLHTEGHSYAYRLQQLLSMSSVVFKQVSPFTEWYYGMLRPYEHVVPFTANHIDDTNVTQAILWAKKHDDEARAIARKGREFAIKHFNNHATGCYWLEALRQYRAQLAFDTRLNVTKALKPRATTARGINGEVVGGFPFRWAKEVIAYTVPGGKTYTFRRVSRAECGGSSVLDRYSYGGKPGPNPHPCTGTRVKKPVGRALGCFQGSGWSSLKAGVPTCMGHAQSDLTPELCAAQCDALGGAYAAVQNGSMCYCGRTRPDTRQDAQGCSEMMGG
eukprot:g2030.t1